MIRPERKSLDKHKEMKRTLTDDTKITITCPKCKHKWEPSPKRWRNFNDMFGPRNLPCSRCSNRVLVPREWVEKIWKYNA